MAYRKPRAAPRSAIDVWNERNQPSRVQCRIVVERRAWFAINNVDRERLIAIAGTPLWPEDGDVATAVWTMERWGITADAWRVEARKRGLLWTEEVLDAPGAHA